MTLKREAGEHCRIVRQHSRGNGCGHSPSSLITSGLVVTAIAVMYKID